MENSTKVTTHSDGLTPKQMQWAQRVWRNSDIASDLRYLTTCLIHTDQVYINTETDLPVIGFGTRQKPLIAPENVERFMTDLPEALHTLMPDYSFTIQKEEMEHPEAKRPIFLIEINFAHTQKKTKIDLSDAQEILAEIQAPDAISQLSKIMLDKHNQSPALPAWRH